MATLNKTLGLFDYLLIIGVATTSILYSLVSGDFDILGIIAAVSGLLCVVLVAKASIYNYIFGVINVSLYAYISYKSSIYGDAALNALYYFPMQFVGWFSWKKNSQESDKSIVAGKLMTNKERLFWSIVSVVSVIIGGIILKYLSDPQPYKDSATTLLSIIATYLMVKAYAEQWVLWIIINIISIIMWTILAIDGDEHSGLMVIMWIFYLANSINGLRVWMKISK
jgi:nicotinamide mononucleotide transporter